MKKKRKILLLIILLLAVTVGYAVLTTTLRINGLSHVAKATWNIHWDNVTNEAGVEATVPAHIKENTKQRVVEYEVFLPTPGDYYEFTVDAINEGTLDGKITSIVSTVNGDDISELPEYIKYSVTYADGTEVKVGDLLKKQRNNNPTRKTYKIRVEYDRDKITPAILNAMDDEGETYVFTYEVQYTQLPRVSENTVAAVSFESDSWSTIAQAGNQAAAQDEVIDNECGAYHVGDTRTVEMDIDGDGTEEEYTVRIANCSTPSVCSTQGFSQTACGFVVEFVDILTTHRMSAYSYDSSGVGNGNKGGWEYSDMRAFLNGGTYQLENINYDSTSIYSKLPSDIQDSIATETFVASSYGNQDTGMINTTDKLYLLTAKEIWGKEGASNKVAYDNGEDVTRQLDYYKSQGTTTNNYSAASKLMNGSETNWWTRTALSDSNCSYYRVSWGDWYTSDSNSELGVSPAFKLY